MKTSMKQTRMNLLPLTASLLLAASGGYAVTNFDFDNGGGTGDWNLNTNWSPDGLPTTADNVFVNVTGAATKTITLASTPVNSSINEVGLARTGDGVSTVNQTGGTLTVRNWFNLGQGAAAAGNNGTGVWNLSGSSVLNVNHAAGGQTVIGVGGTSSPTYNTGILTLSGSAQFLQTAAEIRIGGEAVGNRANGTVTLNDNAILSHTGGGQFVVGLAANGSTGSLDIHNSASLTTAGVFIVGKNTGSSGSVLQDGASTVTVNGAYMIIGGPGTGTYTMNSGTLTFTGKDGLNVGDNAGSAGTFAVNGGQVNVNGATTPDIYLGKYSGTGTMTVKNNAQVVVNRNMYLGFNGVSSAGTLTVDNTASVTSATLMVWAGAGTVNVNGGTVNATSWITLGQNAGSTAVFNHNAGNVTTAELYTTFQASGTYNLNGGTLSTAKFSKSTGTGIFNFNGGTLKATGAFNLSSSNVTTAQVRNGGALIDSNGQVATISQALIHSAIGGDNATDGGLTKSGAGTLVLSGVNTYNGATTINGGTLLAATLAAGGSNSAIGASPAAAGNLVFNGGTLRYDANTAAQTTNRLFTLGTGGGSFDSSSATAANTMSFTATGAIATSGSGSRLLTLTGSNTGANTMAAAIVDGPGGSTSLTKSGAGNWVLSGTSNNFTGTLSVSGGTLSVPTLSGNGSGSLQLSNGGILAYTGATQATSRGLSLTNASGGNMTVPGGTALTMGAITGSTADFAKAGTGTFNYSGTSEVNKFTVNAGTVRQTAGVTTINAASYGLQVGPGAYRLESGTLKTDRITLLGGGSFAWGVTDGAYATLTTKQARAGVANGIDRTGSTGAPSGPVVREGTRINVTGDLATTNRSILDLGPLYSSAGQLYDNISITGILDLSAPNDTLNFEVNPFFLRPSSPDSVLAGDWGTLVLVRATSITGAFNNITGIGNDSIGWTQYTGTPVAAKDLPINTWYVETLASGFDDGPGVAAVSGVVLFHYKVAGSVPEPASAGLLVAGGLVLRALARRRKA